MATWILAGSTLVLGLIVLFRPSARLSAALDVPGSTLFGFALMAIGVTSPLAIHPSQMLLDDGAGPQALVSSWSLWWTWTSILSGTNPYTCHLIYPPDGTGLALHGHPVTYGVLTLPLRLLLGDGSRTLFAAYNGIVLVSFALSGYFVYRMAIDEARLAGMCAPRHWVATRGAALVAALTFAYSAYHFANVSRLSGLGVEWLVFFIWRADAWHARSTVRRSILLSVALVLLLGISFEYLVYGLLAIAVIFLVRWRRTLGTFAHLQTTPSPRRAVLGFVVFLAVLALTTPFWQAFSSQASGRLPTVSLESMEDRTASYADYVSPNVHHPLWGSEANGMAGSLGPATSDAVASLGWIALVLFLIAGTALFRTKRQRVWIVGTLIFLLLALGLLHRIASPISSFGLSAPVAFVPVAQLFLSLTIALGLASLWYGPVLPPTVQTSNLVPTRRRLTLALGTLVVFELLAVPLRSVEVPAPSVYEWIAEQAALEASASQETPAQAVLHVPHLTSRESLFYQTLHGQTVADNLDSAIPTANPLAPDILDQIEFGFLALEMGEPNRLQTIPAGQRENVQAQVMAFLEAWGVRWIVIPPAPELDAASRAAYTENLRAFGAREIHADGNFIVADFGP